MNTAGTTASSAHSTGLRRQSRQPPRTTAASWSAADPGRAFRRGRAIRPVAMTTVYATAAAPTVQSRAMPRSPSRPPWRNGPGLAATFTLTLPTVQDPRGSGMS
jgi:hypothetical protein